MYVQVLNILFKFLGYTRTYGLNWHLINSKCRVIHNTLYVFNAFLKAEKPVPDGVLGPEVKLGSI